MAGYGLTFCAALSAALITTCAPAPVPPSASGFVSAPASYPAPVFASASSTVPSLRVADIDICTQLPLVGEVSSSFDPATQNGKPTVYKTSIDPIIVADIYAAFYAAPDFFKKQLCGLAGIYITSPDSTSRSWGYRDVADPDLKRYIALSTRELWPTVGSGAVQLHDYKRKELFNLLPKLAGDPLQNQIQFRKATFNPGLPWNTDGPMTVLAALAHEFGHVLWLDLFVKTPRTNPDFTAFCVAGGTPLPRDFWTASPYWLRWQEFGLVNDYPQEFPDELTLVRASDDPLPADARIGKLKDRLNVAENSGKEKDYKKARKIMARILAKVRPWPSLFGAFSVNEQFVETFTLYTLLSAKYGLTSLALSIPDGNPPVQDIPQTLNSRNKLTKMLDCFASLYGPYPVP